MAGANVMLVRWAGGWTERSVAGPKRTEAMLSVGALKSLPEAHRVADAQLAHYAQLQRVITVGTVPDETVEAPVAFYTGMHVGDRLSAPDGSNTDPDTQIPWRVGAITVQEDNDSGIASTTPTLIVPTASPGAQLNIDADVAIFQAAKKMANGTLAGQSKVAQPPAYRKLLQPVTRQNTALRLVALIANFSSGIGGGNDIHWMIPLDGMISYTDSLPSVPPPHYGPVQIAFMDIMAFGAANPSPPTNNQPPHPNPDATVAPGWMVGVRCGVGGTNVLQPGHTLHLMDGSGPPSGYDGPTEGPQAGDSFAGAGDAGAVYFFDLGLPIVVAGGAGGFGEVQVWDSAPGVGMYVTSFHDGGPGGRPAGGDGGGPTAGGGGGPGGGGGGGGATVGAGPHTYPAGTAGSFFQGGDGGSSGFAGAGAGGWYGGGGGGGTVESGPAFPADGFTQETSAGGGGSAFVDDSYGTIFLDRYHYGGVTNPITEVLDQQFSTNGSGFGMVYVYGYVPI